MSPRDQPTKFFLRPPADFWDLPEAAQLEWTRSVGRQMAASLGDSEKPESADEPAAPEATDPSEP